MQHIVIVRLKPDATEDQQAKHRMVEAIKVWELTVAGVLRSIHFFSGSGRGAVLQIETKDRAEAEACMQQLPMVKAGLLEAEVLSLAPYSGLDILFAPRSA
jgi:phage-related baseplate assembly protein